MVSGYADFSGRSPRSSMWKFILLASLGGLLATLISGMLIDSLGDWGIAFFLIYTLALVVPFVSLSVRRLNDMGWPALLSLLYLVPVVGMLLVVPLLFVRNAEVVDARKQYMVARAAARDAAARADQSARELSTAQARLLDLESGHGAYLGSVGQAVLHEFWITVPGYSGPVRGARARTTQHGDVHSVSDVTGKTKGGLGGAVVGGLALGPVGAVVGSNVARKTTVQTTVRTVDTRTYDLEIAGPDFMYVLGGPDADSLYAFRDLVNTRGSSNEDVQAMASAQLGVVKRHEELAAAASLAAEAANKAADEFESRMLSIVSASSGKATGRRSLPAHSPLPHSPQAAAASGWYPDPLGRHEYRYWTGSAWGHEVATGGVVGADPLDVVPDPLA